MLSRDKLTVHSCPLPYSMHIDFCLSQSFFGSGFDFRQCEKFRFLLCVTLTYGTLFKGEKKRLNGGESGHIHGAFFYFLEVKDERI